MHEGELLSVFRAVHHAPVASVAFPHTKIVVVIAAQTRLTHRNHLAPLAEGDIAILPLGARVGGGPLPTVETVKLHFDSSYLRQQLTWSQQQAPLTALLDGTSTPVAALDLRCSDKAREPTSRTSGNRRRRSDLGGQVRAAQTFTSWVLAMRSSKRPTWG